MKNRQRIKNKRGKMKNLFCFLYVIAFSSVSLSQSIMETKELTIQSSFDNLTIQSFAIQGESKSQDFFYYLKFLENKDNSPDLNQQIVLNIEQLFEEEILLRGLENKKNYFSFSSWLNDWKTESIVINSFTLIKSQLENTHWIYEYQLNYTSNAKQKSKKVSIKVNFQPETKSFGKTTKEVWSLKIKSVIF